MEILLKTEDPLRSVHVVYLCVLYEYKKMAIIWLHSIIWLVFITKKEMWLLRGTVWVFKYN